MHRIFRVLSLGAGVQSSTLAMLYENGILAPCPDLAVFADTQTEPQKVYDYLKFLKGKIKSFPILTCSYGDIAQDVENGRLSPPFYIKKSLREYRQELAEWQKKVQEIQNSCAKKFRKSLIPYRPKRQGMLRRQCTYKYKIRPVQKAIRKALGYQKYQRVKEHVELIMGISTDEITRMKDSQVKWITHKFPLIELNWSRKDCLSYFERQGLACPPRSACWMCPYRSDREWSDLKQNHPKEFQKAIEFDLKIRKLDGLKYKNYLHRSCRPLGRVVFKSGKSVLATMDNECDGICGL